MEKIKRVLVVDDEPVICDTLKFFLEIEGLEVFTASNGAEGLELLKAQQLDLVISDIRMPVMNGREMFQKMKEQNIDVPLIFISGFSDLGNLSDFLDMGAKAVVKKPFTEDAILQKIESLNAQRT